MLIRRITSQYYNLIPRVEIYSLEITLAVLKNHRKKQNRTLVFQTIVLENSHKGLGDKFC